MTESPTISKLRPADISMDYDRLREEGIQHLEQLATASGIWTDFNAHDPGITILEVLCYAITDLGYRTNLPVEDLFAPKPGTSKPSFFTAVEALPNSSVTPLDFRKLIIDVAGVKNAWVFKHYPAAAPKDDVIPRPPLVYAGADVSYKPLDRPAAEQLLRRYFCLSAENENEPCPDRPHHGVLTPEQAEVYLNELMTFSEMPDGLAALEMEFTELAGPEVAEAIICDIKCGYAYYALSLKKEEESDEQLIFNGLYDILIELEDYLDPDSTKKVQLVKDRVYDRLHANRNLGEDFVNIHVVKSCPFCICLDLELVADSNEGEVMAEVLFALQQFLTPKPRFYSFEELREKGWPCDRIFNGPLLDNGFLPDAELTNAPLRQKVYKSDLYRIILEHPQVHAVKEFSLKKAHEAHFGSQWCLDFTSCGLTETEHPCTHIYKPVIDICCSRLRTSKGVLQTVWVEKDLLPALELLQLNQFDPAGPGKRPGILAGQFRADLADYSSIQHEFPENYAIGAAGLSIEADSLRKAQVKQLQAYLLFYDQILAAYLQQLASVRDLLSVHQDPEEATYFFQALYEVPGMPDLIKSFAHGDYSPEDWSDFQENPENGYLDLLKELVEDESGRQLRRNRLMDHLLARFGERFTEYTLKLFETRVDREADPNTQSLPDYLQAKHTFLAKLPELGGQRGRAYNYRAIHADTGEVDVWETNNVSGLKKRVSRLLGIANYQTRSLFCDPNYALVIQKGETKEGFTTYQILLVERGQENKVLLYSPVYKQQRKRVNEIRDILYTGLDDLEHFSLGKKGGKFFAKFEMEDQEHGKILLQGPAMSEAQAENWLADIKELILDSACEQEGFHILEHILLRPEDEDDDLLKIPLRQCDTGQQPPCLPTDENGEPLLLPLPKLRDPYSFCVSVILPNWPQRFREANFQTYIEQLFRREAPAHIALRFCWLDEDQMQAFERPFQQWRKEKALCSPNNCNVTKYANQLIEWLNTTVCSCYCSPNSDLTPFCLEPEMTPDSSNELAGGHHLAKESSKKR